MSPFEEATYEQLGRLLVILDYYKNDPANGLSIEKLHEWASGENFQPSLSTEFTLEFWERVIFGETPDNPYNKSSDAVKNYLNNLHKGHHMIYTFHYAEPADNGGFHMSLDPGHPDPNLTVTEDIEAGSLREAYRKWDDLHPDRLVVQVTYPMNELEAHRIQLGDGRPV